MGLGPKTRDYFAELYVAGLMADSGWDIYFPMRDKGFDFIASRNLNEKTQVRPVQVKGLYPTKAKTPKSAYGYMGKLTALHDDMVLALPYFMPDKIEAPVHVAWLLRDDIKLTTKGRFKAQPASYRSSGPEPRRDFWHVFNRDGLARVCGMS